MFTEGRGTTMSFASKLKLISTIDDDKTLNGNDMQKLHRLLSVRNAFAHTDLSESKRVVFDENNALKKNVFIVTESLSADGRLKEENREDTYIEAFDITKMVCPKLKAIRDKLDQPSTSKGLNFTE